MCNCSAKSFTTVPAGYTGGAVWSSGSALDIVRGTIYVDTGNNYSLPAASASCVQQAGGNMQAITTSSTPLACPGRRTRIEASQLRRSTLVPCPELPGIRLGDRAQALAEAGGIGAVEQAF